MTVLDASSDTPLPVTSTHTVVTLLIDWLSYFRLPQRFRCQRLQTALQALRNHTQSTAQISSCLQDCFGSLRPFVMSTFSRLLCSLLAVLSLVDATGAAVTGLTFGMVTQGDSGTFYLHHLPLNVTAAQPTVVTPTSNGSTILFLNNDAYEGLMFSPPQGSNTEWLIPLDNEAGGVLVHYNMSSELLQIDQVHSGLMVGPYVHGDIQQILWLESQQSFLGISVDENYDRGELYLDFYADMVNELQQSHPEPVDNITLSLGAHNQYLLDKQTMAVSQKDQRLFLMPQVWNQQTNLFYAALWTYDIVNMSVSGPVGYRNNSSTMNFISTLVYSETRGALYAVVAVFYPFDNAAVHLLVDRIDWTTGEVTHITDDIPVPKAGLASLRATLDDDSGDIYVTFLSVVPNVAGYVILINTVNVDSNEVHTLAELPTVDIPLGIDLTDNGSSGNRHTQHQVENTGTAAPQSASAPQLELSKRPKRRSLKRHLTVEK